MLDFLLQLNNGQVIAIGLAAMVAVMVLPRLMRGKRQQRITLKHLTGGRLNNLEQQQAEHPVKVRNGGGGEIEQLASKLMGYARANSMKLVYPGIIKYDGKSCGFTMLLVGRFGILGVKAYGYGGRVEPAARGWQQIANGETRKIPNPVQAVNQDARALSAILEAKGYHKVPIESAAIFTHKPLVLEAPDGVPVYQVDSFFDHVYQSTSLCAENGIDVASLVEMLVSMVKETTGGNAADKPAKGEPSGSDSAGSVDDVETDDTPES